MIHLSLTIFTGLVIVQEWGRNSRQGRPIILGDRSEINPHRTRRGYAAKSTPYGSAQVQACGRHIGQEENRSKEKGQMS